MTVKQISVFIENRPGRLAEFANIFSDNEINMRAMNIAETPDFGVLRIIVDDPFKAANVIKDAGYIASVTNVLAVAIPDQPGSLLGILTLIGQNDINLEYTYAFPTREKETAYMIMRVMENEKAVQVLSQNGVKLVSQEELLELY